jgi:UDP-glucose 4-epimerase
MSTLAWVLGSGGLLGSNVLQAMAQDSSGMQPWRTGSSGIPWEDPGRGLAVLEQQAAAFAGAVGAAGAEWAVLWCAGAGAVGTSLQALEIETAYLASLLAALGRHFPARGGKVLLVSSAGGVYGNNPEQPLTEASACHPISDYGRNKLRQESLLRDWGREHAGSSTLVARISNLYGPAPRINKAHGLIAHISRSILQRVPINIFVPLDTLRDYIFVGDCVAGMLAGMARLGANGREDVLKIFAAGETTSIAGLVGIFSRLTHGRVRIICSSSPVASQQPLRLQFRSTVWEDVMPEQNVSLTVGIARVHAHMISKFQMGLLPPAR